MPYVIVQKWEELVVGLGVKSDGYSLHLNQENLKTYIQGYWEGMPGEIAYERYRPIGTHYTAKVDEKTFLAVLSSKNGTRHFDKKYPRNVNSWWRLVW